MGSCGVSDVRQHLRSLSSKHGANALPSTPAGSYLLVLPDAFARHWRHRTYTAARASGRLGWVPPWGVLTFGLGNLSQHGNIFWFRHN